MHCRVFASEVARKLTARGHINSTTGPAWRPGHRVSQASPKTARIWHDGPDEQAHLDQYATALRTAGYTVAAERPAGKRPSLRITHQTTEK
ncbi:hypothetical protein GCM10010330_56860 [Streptomyces tendae]|uniref:hypothetical protein n=1 Tax=Streptomyces tendae TaxID=1932 RepID=UPI001677D104|nr:hypothetical protein [Streptomyces tendae]GHA95335.1 hypothetical protein GCM10010330_56860 [Streptomyces tendae]